MKIILLILSLIFPLQAMAYIDPGSGSALLSAIFGIFVAVSLVAKNYWYKIKSLFKKQKSKEAIPK